MKLPIVGIDFITRNQHFRIFRTDTSIWITHSSWNLVAVGDTPEEAFCDLILSAGALYRSYEHLLEESLLDEFRYMMTFLVWLSIQDPKEFEWNIAL